VRILAALAMVAGVALCVARAEAVVEHCPAAVIGFHAVAEPGSGNASKTYGFKVGALGERTVSGTIAIETDAGWFTATFPSHHLYESTRSLDVGGHSYGLTAYTEPTLFVSFPSSVLVRRMWVAQASATNDGPFGWQARGSTTCDPPVALAPSAFAGVWNAADDDEHPPTTFVSPFAPASVASVAASVDPPAGSNCAQPFRDARIVTAALPVWPDSLGPALRSRSVSGILVVALDARGTVEDVWPWAPSPYDELNAAEVSAALKGTYAPGIALCRAVPSLLFFRYEWSPKAVAPKALGT
jgi:hypothetical protein